MTAQPYKGTKVLFQTGRPHDPVVTDVEYIKPEGTRAKTESFFTSPRVEKPFRVPSRGRDEKDRPAQPVFFERSMKQGICIRLFLVLPWPPNG